MIKNYILIAIRTLKRKSIYSLINVIGLAVGLLCVIFIYNWVQDELRFDEHFSNKNNIYRIVGEVTSENDVWDQAVTSLPLGPTVKESFPEVKEQTRLIKSDAIVERNGERFWEDYMLLTDSTFFNVFDYKLISGNKETALSKPLQIILTETLAKKYFGDVDPMGKSLKIYHNDPNGQGVDYKITGVVEDPPKTSHFTFNSLISINTLAQVNPAMFSEWFNNSFFTYIVLDDKSSKQALDAKLPEMVDLHMGETLKGTDLSYRFYLQSITDIHLKSDIQYEFMPTGNMEYVWLFSVIGIFILVLASINYINLTTSFSLDRIKEMGVRKSMGAFKSQLIKQLLIETLVIGFISMLLAGLLIELLKPVFYDLTGKVNIEFLRVNLLLQLIIISIPLSLFSGFFPAYMLSKVKTVNSLKGKLVTNNKQNFRSVLVTFQFVVTLVILVGLLVVHEQMSFVQSKELGYNKNHLMVLATNGSVEVAKNYENFETNLLASSNTISISRSSTSIGTGLGNGTSKNTDANGRVTRLKTYRLPVDFNYLETYGIQLLAGRDFSNEMSSDSTESFIVNQAFVNEYNWDVEQAMNKEIQFVGRTGKIIGVVDNFHYSSLHEKIGPVCMYIPNRTFSRISIKGVDDRRLLRDTKAAWQQAFPSSLFNYEFQEEKLANSYDADYRFGKIFNVFTVLSIFIAFMGLFGLVGYQVKHKTKEIGIRKVLGASAAQIIQMISGRFIGLILVASVISIPIAWYLMKSWLSDFTYRIDINIWYFAIAIASLLLLAIVIVFTQTLKPSLANPIDSLKEE